MNCWHDLNVSVHDFSREMSVLLHLSVIAMTTSDHYISILSVFLYTIVLALDCTISRHFPEMNRKHILPIQV